MSSESVLGQVDGINVWSRGSERAPHKPLLLLWALARFSQGHAEPVPYEVVAPELEALLREFGPSRRSYHPEYPFWRLQNDGLWSVSSDEPLRSRESNTDPPKSELLGKHAKGQLSPAVLKALEEDPSLLSTISERVLTAHFPETLHEDILAAVGMELARRTQRRAKRDARFRARVLLTYEYRCAVCGLELRLGSVSVGLEAAHIRWHQAGGPDVEQNGLALCSNHHKLFDLGAYTIEPGERRILVSEQIHGSGEFDYTLLRHHGSSVRPPQHPDRAPAPKHLAWHRREVFKEGARHLEVP